MKYEIRHRGYDSSVVLTEEMASAAALVLGEDPRTVAMGDADGDDGYVASTNNQWFVRSVGDDVPTSTPEEGSVEWFR